MSSSDRPARPALHRGAVLAPEALAAYGLAGAGDGWRPLELETSAPTPVPNHGHELFAAFDAPALAHGGVADLAAADDDFASVLPELSAWAGDADGSGLLLPDPYQQQRLDLQLDAMREQFEQELAERMAAEAARQEQELAQAYAAGVAAGHAEGAAAVEQELAAAVAALHAAAGQVVLHEERWLSHLQENVAVLAVAVARHVIGREVEVDPAIVQARVAEAVAEFPVQHALVVRVHPADVATLKAAEAGTAGAIRLLGDDRVERGGCLVEGRERIVDGRVDAALERVYRQLSGQHA